jgi:hypothetical protein
LQAAFGGLKNRTHNLNYFEFFPFPLEKDQRPLSAC